jgi:hypothetical protein
MGVCPKHCPATDLTVPVVATASVAIGVGAAWFAVTYAVVLAVGAVAVVVAAVALQVILRRHTVVRLPQRAAVAGPIRSHALDAARQRAAITAAPSRVLEGVVITDDRVEVRR